MGRNGRGEKIRREGNGVKGRRGGKGINGRRKKWSKGKENESTCKRKWQGASGGI